MFSQRKNKFLISLVLSVAMVLGSFLLTVPQYSYAVTIDQIVDKVGGLEKAAEIFSSLKLLTKLNDYEIGFLADFGREHTKEYLYLVTSEEEKILEELGVAKEELKSIFQAFQGFVHDTDNLKNLRNGISHNTITAAEDMANKIISYLSPEVKEALKNSDEEIVGAVLGINRYAIDRLRLVGKMGETALTRIFNGNPSEGDKTKLAELGLPWENLKSILDYLSVDEKTTFKGIVWKLADQGTSGSGGSSGNGNGIGDSSKVTFTDIIDHWAQADIEFMYNKGYVKGIEENIFAPDAQIARAEFASLLQRIFNLTEKSASYGFKDISVDSWYNGSVNATAFAKLVMGYPDGNFRPWGKISREEMAVMVVRALAYGGQDKNVTQADVEAMLAKFEDQSEIGSWARESTAKAVDSGIVMGRSEKVWAPLDTATRAEGVVMLKRLLVKLGKI